MNSAQVRALLDTGILQAFAEGKTVQRAWPDWWEDDTYIDFERVWRYPHLFRIKPEPMHDWAIESSVEDGTFYMLCGKTAGWMREQYPRRHYRQLVDVLDEE